MLQIIFISIHSKELLIETQGENMLESPQYTRTDKAITQALISLLKVKPFEKITVQNILDETPVTRSTFYKHFHDKYEIVERLQEDFFASQMELHNLLHDNPKEITPAFLKLSLQNKEILETLLKVKTENVDFRQTLVSQCESFYLKNAVGPNSKIEAQIFAQAITAFQLSSDLIREEFSFEFMHDVFISVLFKILGFSEDEELRKILKEKSISTTSL